MDHTSKGWLCPDLYMKEGCIAGYVCNQTLGQCQIGKPGEGGHLDKCKETCHPPAPPPPPQFVCNVTTLMCEKAPASGQPTKEGCASTCGNHTPTDLLGLWRGLDVQVGFSVGEWVMNFSETSVAWGPYGAPDKFAADVAMLGPQKLQLTMTKPYASKGDVRMATYSNAGWPTGPETWSFSIALQSSGSHVAPPVSLPGDAIGTEGLDVFVFHGCHEYHGLCDFSPAFAPPAAREGRLLPWLRLSSATTDTCGAHSSCGECIGDASGQCGWCDGLVTFHDGSTCGGDGKGCCGGSSGFSRCDPGYRKACPVICDWQSHAPAGKHPFCREATSKEFNSSIAKYADCKALNASYSCQVPDFGQYCNKTAAGGRGQCQTAKTKDDCAKNPLCNTTNPVCDPDCDSERKSITYCSPDAGCKGPVSKSECAADPNCDPDHSGCDPSVCKAPEWYTCNTDTSQCETHTGERPGPGTPYYNKTEDCKKACVSHDVSGVWRGLRVDKGFEADEWDFTFAQAGAGSAVVFKSKKTGTKYVGTYAIGAALDTSVEKWFSFELNIKLASGFVLKGLVSNYDSDAEHPQPSVGPYTRFLYLGLPIQDGDVAISYDDAMAADKQEFVLISCLPSDEHCDFSPAKP